MLKYINKSFKKYNTKSGIIYSFIDKSWGNVDIDTVNAFGEEWKRFKTFNDEEIRKIGNDYFDIVPWESLGTKSIALDVGCGSGRWAKYVTSKLDFVEAIEPSKAAFTTAEELSTNNKIRVTIADIDRIPFKKGSFDFVYSLGVLHHIPDTAKALNDCVKFLKKGGFFLVYLYYNLDNRGILYQFIFKISNLIRLMVSSFHPKVKVLFCDALAIILYAPLINLSRLLEIFRLKKLSEKVPLAYYKKTSWKIVRNDSLDRFGTPLEQRFNKKEIESMMINAGLENIVFSEKQPFWHAIGQKK